MPNWRAPSCPCIALLPSELLKTKLCRIEIDSSSSSTCIHARVRTADLAEVSEKNLGPPDNARGETNHSAEDTLLAAAGHLYDPLHALAEVLLV